MREKLVLVLLTTFVLLPTPGPVAAEEPQATDAPTAASVTVASWKTLQAKIRDMAADFPQELFDYRPHPDSRSFADEIWHVAAGNEVLAAQLKGEPIDRASLVVPASDKHDRDKMVARLTASAEECAELLQTHYHPRSIRTLEHMGEHYGKLVTIYRVNGLVPPSSR